MFTDQLLSFFLACHFLMAPVRAAPDPKSTATIFTPLGISLTVVGISLDGQDLVCRLGCVDRTGLTEPLRLRIASPLFGTKTLGMPVDPTKWEIGSLITIRRSLPKDIPSGVCAVELASVDGAIPLGKLTLYAEAHLPLVWQGWFFNLRTERLPLIEALSVDPRVGLSGEVLTFACNPVPNPNDWVGVEGVFRVKIGEPVSIGLEIHDSYPPRGHPGNLEQRVYANDVLISRQDVGGDLSVGWYAVDTTIVATDDPLLLRVEVVPLKSLGPWGYGKASRTGVRNVRVIP